MVNRRIERLDNVAATLARFLRRYVELDQPLHHELAVEALLELCDSIITYRTRYRAQPELLPAIHLLTMDDANPHALAFQLRMSVNYLSKFETDSEALGVTELESAFKIADRITVLDQGRILMSDTVAAVRAGSPVFGWIGGSGWEWANLAFLGGGLWMCQRRVAAWQIPAGMLGALALVSTVFWIAEPARFAPPWFHVMSGAAVFGAFFIATDPVSASTTPRGRLIYGAGIGLLTWLMYSTSGLATLWLAAPGHVTSPLYLAAGIGLATVLGWGRWMAAAVGLGAMTVVLTMQIVTADSLTVHAAVQSVISGAGAGLQAWLAARGWDWDTVHTTFYSDSMNDLPLLEKADVPVATNPDARLRQLALERQWRILDLFAGA